jgi:hypothetical protein
VRAHSAAACLEAVLLQEAANELEVELVVVD